MYIKHKYCIFLSVKSNKMPKNLWKYHIKRVQCAHIHHEAGTEPSTLERTNERFVRKILCITTGAIRIIIKIHEGEKPIKIYL